MKKLLVMALVTVMAGGAMAECLEDFDFDCHPNTLGIFFDQYTGRFVDQLTGPELSDAGTNSNVETLGGFNGPFAWMYLVLIRPSVEFFHTAEFGIYTDAEWIEGFSTRVLYGPEPNFVASDASADGNYSALFTWPDGFPVCMDGATVLARFRMNNWWGGEYVPIKLGPLWHLSPPTVPGHFIIIQGDDRIICTPPVGPGDFGPGGITTVATFFGSGIIATEDHTLSSVKALFR